MRQTQAMEAKIMAEVPASPELSSARNIMNAIVLIRQYVRRKMFHYGEWFTSNKQQLVKRELNRAFGTWEQDGLFTEGAAFQPVAPFELSF